MPAIPLPFVVALLLGVLFARLVLEEGPSGRLSPAAIFVAACTMMVLVVGLRWSLDVRWIRFVQPIIALALPPLAWICFTDIGRERRRPLASYWPHALPLLLMIVLSATWALWHPPIDAVVAASFFAYGAALLRFAARGVDSAGAVRLGDIPSVLHAIRLAALFLIVSALVDLAIAVDFDLYAGEHAVTIVAIANLGSLLAIAAAVAVVGASKPEPVTDEASLGEEASDAARALDRQDIDADTDQEVIAAIDRLLRERGLFRDPDLTLDRLARRAGIPARQISSAINRRFGRNISQVVNEYRVEDAKRRLAETDEPVTSVMFESGFQTKSNFNREFRRVTGMSPSDYRRSAEVAVSAP
ncbi:Bacillibactin transport regulator [Hartmannibacter diazotrophicus]|uniref:Bacillibactin transport regulator n=1 Tax=Hartmannibacter diazotrophicus TaxID=1482074 RepID=A0A2C9D2S8_9HYPH|nr:AraC family transcriptional regulator [Hartmannibacter diazotrophicus]SON54533.1 Bacillibactin transport regulator [Hartmannibacter diazotrophicus]